MSDRVSNTAERLKQLMRERNLKQIDIVDLCQPFFVRNMVSPLEEMTLVNTQTARLNPVKISSPF